MGFKARNYTLMLSLFMAMWISVVADSPRDIDRILPDIYCEDGKLSIDIREMPLGTVVDRIREECHVTISGLEDRRDEPVSFTSELDTPEAVLKRFMKSLGETNIAYEFSDDRLRRISTFPKSEGTIRISDDVPSLSQPVEEYVTVVRIDKIIEDTQAESLGFQSGDIILEYGGVKIRSSQQLVEEVKKTTPDEEVELLVLSNGIADRYMVNGGFIGINIRTVRIPRKDLLGFF